MSDVTKSPIVMDINQIKEIIPHRYPFLLVDRVVEINYETQTLVAIKNVTANEPFFVGHYPHYPVMPGVLVVEAMAQASCIYMLSVPENKGKTPFFAAIDGVKFRRQIVPGDQLRLICVQQKMKRRVAKCRVECFVYGDLAVEAELTCMLADAPGQE